MKEAARFHSKTPNPDPTHPGNGQELSEGDETDGHYAYELVCGDDEYSDLIRDSVVVKLLRKMVSEEGFIKLVFGFVFVPPRALRYIHTHTLSCTMNHP